MIIVNDEDTTGCDEDTTGQQVMSTVSFTITQSVIIEQPKKDIINEKLAPNEVYVIEKEGDTIVYVTNLLGRLYLKRATME